MSLRFVYMMIQVFIYCSVPNDRTVVRDATVALVWGYRPDRCFAVIFSEFLVLMAQNLFMMYA